MAFFSSRNIKNEEVGNLFEKGLVSQKSGDYNSAIKFLKSAIDMDPSFIEAYNSLGLTYKKTGDFDNALKSYNQGIEVLFQKIYDGIKKGSIKFLNDNYTLTKSKTWLEVVTQITTKNGAQDGIEVVRFPTGETAVKLTKENSVVGPVFKDEGGARYISPAYFSTFYEALKSDTLYSIIVNNVGTLFTEQKYFDKAKECFLESIEFIPSGMEYNDPLIALKEIENY